MGVRVSILVFLGALLTASSADAQYFGRNKVRYDSTAFQTIQTPHFDIYFRPDALDAARLAGRLAERWYGRLSKALSHELTSRQPLVLYSSHSAFEQTNVIGGMLGESIGGVTEGMMRRIILPFDAGLGETDHVIGHELVHAFQYDIASVEGRSLAGVPLWFIEGMAEFLSVGPDDQFTAMLLRDATAHDRLPAIRELSRARMSPYRSGQALWAWLASSYGDPVVRRIYSAKPRDVIKRIEQVTRTNIDVLAQQWHKSIRATAGNPPITRAAGNLLVGGDNGGRLNIAPALSPDGSRLLFMSERDRLSIDVFVYDVRAERIDMKLVTTAEEPQVESLGFLRSSGSWSADGAKVVLSLVKKGRPVLSIYDVADGSHESDIPIDGVDQVFQPAWSPDGRFIAFSGLTAGTSDLYLFDIVERGVSRLTTDAYTDMQPAWSPDSTRLAFATDRFTTDLETLRFGAPQLAILDLGSRQVTSVQPAGHSGSDPVWAAGARALAYRTTVDGATNVFRVELADGSISQITSDGIGVTGLTPFSPALSVARATGALAFTVLRDGQFEIRTLDERAHALEADRPQPGALLARVPHSLPGWRMEAATPPTWTSAASPKPYVSKLSLAGIGQPHFSMGAGGGGNFIRGGTSFLFADMLGDRRLGIAFQAGKRLEDLAVQARYTNRASRWTYGVAVELLPYIDAERDRLLGATDAGSLLIENSRRERQLHTVLSGLVAYPFHRSMRVEMRAGFHTAHYHRATQSRTFSLPDGRLLTEERDGDALAPKPLRLFEAGAALVRDTAVFGAVSPILGTRMRLEIVSARGDLNYVHWLGDYRKYWLLPGRPYTLALRLLHSGRYGSGADDRRLLPMSLRRQAYVRGAEAERALPCDASQAGRCVASDNSLEGSKMMVGQLELRFPLLGALAKHLTWGGFPIEGFGFADAGLVWWGDQAPSWFGGGRPAARSAGGGIRVRLAHFVLEAAAAHRFDRTRGGWVFAFNARPPF